MMEVSGVVMCVTHTTTAACCSLASMREGELYVTQREEKKETEGSNRKNESPYVGLVLDSRFPGPERLSERT